MPTPKQLYGLTVALVLAGAVGGCAAFQRCSPENCAIDAKISADEDALFAEHREFGPPAAVHVQTLNGVVYLTGTVDTEFEVRHAEALVRRVANVKDVVNNLNARSNGR